MAMFDDENPIHVLDDEQSWDFLEAHEFGRLAFHLIGEVHITPINYVSDSRARLLFRTSEGNKLLAVTMNDDVAFEVDEFSDTNATSVVLRGRARALERSEADAVESLPLRPWVHTDKMVVVEIIPTEMSGRSFDLERPWLHARPSD
ncbi:MAG: pyridoxamine 5'-phosphate oxidase family protein [Tetrasphaera jenkinsii]|jgi:uncharacterized protein|uniref:Uncharacterized protein n=2 Tax=Nostocoides jenkinsii TaxID=330834 RepID=A0A077M6K8_9MICO|nr:pyridoxamine 5'-phosphate oxidase family protein [Tetrasphaera jenkinsii]CCI51410.1 conserved hypothetical protein [Tetrasphaera jenkinsii Ben 74]